MQSEVSPIVKAYKRTLGQIVAANIKIRDLKKQIAELKAENRKLKKVAEK